MRVARRQRLGYVKERVRVKGTRYTGLYLVHDGRYVSAGTFDTHEEAEAAWQEQVHAMRAGTHADPRKGRTPFRDFAEIFLQTAAAQRANTLSAYRDTIRAQLNPAFGDMPLMEITPEVVVRWIRGLKDAGYAASSIRTWKGQLSGILQSAVVLRYLVINPCAGVRTPKSPPRRIRALIPEDAGRLVAALPGPASRMLVELDLQSGCRWGEITELRGRDVRDDPDAEDRVYLNLTRAVIDIGADDNPAKDGGRFYVEDMTKGGRDRKVGLSVTMTDKLLDYMEHHAIEDDDLLFPLSRLRHERHSQSLAADSAPTLIPADLGRTTSNRRGRTYEHGTIAAYSLGACRCDWCRLAMTRYRQQRRADGKDLKDPRPSKRGKNLTDHLPRDWFRRNLWIPAIASANFTGKIVFHDLRHTHATWLARSHKVDIERLRERMGHRSIVTTQQYISATTAIDTTAADVIEETLRSRPSRHRRARSRAPLQVV
jgi:integrase